MAKKHRRGQRRYNHTDVSLRDREPLSRRPPPCETEQKYKNTRYKTHTLREQRAASADRAAPAARTAPAENQEETQEVHNRRPANPCLPSQQTGQGSKHANTPPTRAHEGHTNTHTCPPDRAAPADGAAPADERAHKPPGSDAQLDAPSPVPPPPRGVAGRPRSQRDQRRPIAEPRPRNHQRGLRSTAAVERRQLDRKNKKKEGRRDNRAASQGRGARRQPAPHAGQETSAG